MKTNYTIADENKLAEEIIGVLPEGSVARLVSDDRDTIRYAVAGFKLRTIVLRRDSLRRLCGDRARAVKVEYLQRDLLRSARRRAEFRYPRVNRVNLTLRTRKLAFAFSR